MIKILVSGDFCPIGRTEKYLKEKRFQDLFNGFEKITNQVDYSIVNFECPITNSDKTIDKTGPCIKTENLNSLKALKFAGFDMLTLANNHILDYSSSGVLDTIKYCKAEKFEIIGAGKNINEASDPVIIELEGVKIGFLNIAENEFCAATDNTPGASTFDFVNNSKSIKSLNNQVDKIVLIYHGGREHYQLPTPNQRKRFRYFIELGVDAIVGHHTHCVGGYEFYKGKPIIYSLGNFIFDYKKKYQTGKWTEGMSVILSLENKNESFNFKLLPHIQGHINDSSLNILNGNDKEHFLKKINDLSNSITNDEIFFNEWRKYIKTQESYYLSSLYVKNIFLRILYMKKIFPSFLLKSNHNKLLLNLIRCESHHEISKEILKK